MFHLLEPTVIPITSSNLHLRLPNNPKNAPQHPPKMLSSDDRLVKLLSRILRMSQNPIILQNRRQHHLLCSLSPQLPSPSLLTQPLSLYRSPKILCLHPPLYLFLCNDRSTQVPSPHPPSLRLPSSHQSLSSSPEKTHSTKSYTLNTTLHKGR